MTNRSNKGHVRNPVLALPAMVAIRRLDPATRAIIRQLLLELRTDARARAEPSTIHSGSGAMQLRRPRASRAEASWRRRKPPMAAYWAAVAVYAGHIARALGASPRAMPVATDRTRPSASPRTG